MPYWIILQYMYLIIIHVLNSHIIFTQRGNVQWEACLGLLRMITTENRTQNPLSNVTESDAFTNQVTRPLKMFNSTWTNRAIRTDYIYIQPDILLNRWIKAATHAVRIQSCTLHLYLLGTTTINLLLGFDTQLYFGPDKLYFGPDTTAHWPRCNLHWPRYNCTWPRYNCTLTQIQREILWVATRAADCVLISYNVYR